MIALLDPRLWLGIVLWTALASGLGYVKGSKDNEAGWIARQAKAAEQARETEQELRRYENRATAAYLAQRLKHQERANALPKIILPADCAVPADVGRVLNDAQRMPDDAGAGPGPGGATETVDSTCQQELEIAKRNYADVCTVNADQVIAIQRRWEEVRKRINAGRSGGGS